MLNPKGRRSTKKKKRRNFSFARFVFVVVFLTFVGVSIYAIFFSPFLKITSINIIGNEKVSQEKILEKINPKISGKYLGSMNKDNLLLVMTGKIKKDMLSDFKIIREVQIKRKFPNSLNVNIFERQPQMVFCSPDKCLVIDEKREAYDYFSGDNMENNFVILTDRSAKETKLGEVVLADGYMNYIVEIREKLSEINIEVENNFNTNSFISKDIRVKTKEGWEIYFNENVSLEKEIEMLKVVLNNKIEESQRKDLEYIDLRIDNKIYYKFREGSDSWLAREADSAPSVAIEKKKDDKDEKEKE